MTATILVGREKSINTIEEAYNKKSPIFAITQTKSDSDLFKKENLNKVGTICRILELIKTPDGNLKAILQGFVSAEIDKIIDNEQYFFSEISVIIQPKINDKDKELISLVKSCAECFSKYSQYNKKISAE
jgi:ATP-dependent Lon protease